MEKNASVITVLRDGTDKVNNGVNKRMIFVALSTILIENMRIRTHLCSE